VFAVVVALLLLASLAGALVTSVNAQRREMAVLRSMGFQPRQVRSSISWQASTAIAVGTTVGLPAGVAIGALIWRRVATRIGVDATVDLAVVWLGLLALCAFAVANMVAVWPASRASHVRPADELRTE
jgi:ABC-type lipoprotein release transport system permease subunit